ncbi:MAG: BamA/TamA family outer membrane protein [Planctomycetia bacterium]|nr:BamA/TamA family outer membrane protein [Planctomycetia bacterium]
MVAQTYTPYNAPSNASQIQPGTFNSDGSFANPRAATSDESLDNPSDLLSSRRENTPGSSELLSGGNASPDLPGGEMSMAPISSAFGSNSQNLLTGNATEEPLPATVDLSLAGEGGARALSAAAPGNYTIEATQGKEHEGRPIVQTQIIGNSRNSTEKIMQYIYSRPGRSFSAQTLDDDIRRMSQSRLFVLVEPYIQTKDEGVAVIFNVKERPIMKYLRFQGNEGQRVAKLTTISGLAVGKPVSPYDVEEARKKIETFYHSVGYAKAVVTTIQGDKTSDLGVIFQINEGPKLRVASTNFVGNTIVSAGRLKTVIQSKPGMFWVFGGELRDEILEDDVRKLEDYYRRLGFFYARIGRRVKRTSDTGWSDVTFVINEGPQASIREIRYVGNVQFDGGALQEDMKIFIGKPFNKDRLDQSIARVRRRYGKAGYVFADIQAETRVLDDPSQCDIIFQVKEGKTYRVGRINVLIEGDFPHTQVSTILNRLSIKPGDLVNVYELQQSERRLRASQLFAVDPSQGKVPKIVYSPPEMTLEAEEIAQHVGGNVSPNASNFGGNSGRNSGASEAPRGSAGAASVGGGAGRSAVSGGTHKVFKTTIAEVDPNLRLNENEALIDITIHGIWNADGGSSVSAQRISAQQGEEDFVDDGVSSEVRDPESGEVYRTFAYPTENDVALYGRVSVSNDDPAYSDSPVEIHDTTPVRYRAHYGGGVPLQPIPEEDSYSTSMSGFEQPATYATQGATPSATQNAAPTTSGGAPAWASVDAASSAPAPQYQDINPRTGQEMAPPAQPGISNPDLTPFTQHISDPPAPGYSLEDWQRYSLPITVQTEETTTGRLMFSLGVSSDSGLVGSVVLDEQNFDIRRWPTSFSDIKNGTAWRGRGQHFRMEAMPGTEVSRYSVSFDEPYLFNTQIGLGTNLMYYERIYDTWDERRMGGQLSLSRALTHDMRAYVSFRGYNVYLDDPVSPTPARLANALGSSDLFGVSFRLVQDRRDSSFLATEGYYASLEFEQVFGTWTYSRFNAQFKKYWLLAERADMSGRHVLSFTSSFSWSGDDTPIYESYFAGGSATIRGFDYRGVSPRDLGHAVGGNVMLLASLEYLFPITADDSIRGVVFVDSGTVEESFKNWDDRYRVAVGLGLRISMPMLGPAPIALDFAVPVSKNDGDEERLFTFTMGLQR